MEQTQASLSSVPFTLKSVLAYASYCSRKNVIDWEAKKELKTLFLF